VFITGATGVGKTYLACALAQKACRDGYDTLYLRSSLLFQDLSVAKGDGRYKKLLASISKKRLLILDDWGLAPLNDEQRRDLLELVEDRHGRGSLIIVSQVSVDHWHKSIGDPTLADAIMDRIIHNAYRIDLKGDTVRPHYVRQKAKQEGGDKGEHLE
jgi:DNA replication protein DnaC